MVPLLDLAVFICAAGLSFILTYCLVRFAHRVKFLDYPDERKRHKTPTPSLGGTGLFLSFWIVVFSGVVLAGLFKNRFPHYGSVGIVISGILLLTPKITGIFFGSLWVLLVGLLDDKFQLPPIQKLFGQALGAFFLMRLGLEINLFSTFGFFGYLITFAWILLIMNAFNFIDSLDGHCAGIALISCMTFFTITEIIHQTMVGVFLLAFAGALAGFLPYNFKPAKTFLGDNGSLFVGYLMATFTLLCKYKVPEGSIATAFIPVLIFGVPIYDTVSVIVVRLFRGLPPWKGDRNHFAHRLVKLGMSERVAVVFSYFIAITIGLVAVLTTQVTLLGAVLVGMVFTGIILVIAFLEFYSVQRVRLSEELSQQHRRRLEDLRKAEEERFG